MRQWELVKSTPITSNRWLQFFRNDYSVDGEIRDYYLIARPDFVVVVARDEQDRILLVRQYRPATDRSYIALPAGYIDLDESAEDAAVRELFEEVGCRGSDWRFIGELHPLPGYVRSTAMVFSCLVPADGSADSPGPDESESLEVMRVPRHNVMKMIVGGEIVEMQAVAAFLLAEAASDARRTV